MPLCAAELPHAEPTQSINQQIKYFIQLPSTNVVIPIDYYVVEACSMLKEIADANADTESTSHDDVIFPINHPEITKDSLEFVIKYIADAYLDTCALKILEKKLKSLETNLTKVNTNINKKIQIYLNILHTMNYLDVRLSHNIKNSNNQEIPVSSNAFNQLRNQTTTSIIAKLMTNSLMLKQMTPEILHKLIHLSSDFEIFTSPHMKTFINQQKILDPLTPFDVYRPEKRIVESDKKYDILYFTPDNKHLLYQYDENLIFLLDIQNNLIVNVFNHVNVTWALLSPDGTKLLTKSCSEHRTVLWDVQTGNILFVFEALGISIQDAVIEFMCTLNNSILFSADSSEIYVVKDQKIIQIWNASNGDYKGELFSAPEAQKITMIYPNPKNNAQIAIATRTNFDLPRITNLWDKQTKQILKSFSHANNLYFSPDGSKLFITYWQRNAELWDAQSCELIRVFNNTSDIQQAMFASNNQTIIIRSNTKVVSSLNIHDDTPSLTPFHDRRETPLFLISNTGKQILHSWSGEAWLWDIFDTLYTKPTFIMQPKNSPIKSLLLSNDGTYAITLSKNNKAELWDFSSSLSDRYLEWLRINCSTLFISYENLIQRSHDAAPYTIKNTHRSIKSYHNDINQFFSCNHIVNSNTEHRQDNEHAVKKRALAYLLQQNQLSKEEEENDKSTSKKESSSFPTLHYSDIHQDNNDYKSTIFVPKSSSPIATSSTSVSNTRSTTQPAKQKRTYAIEDAKKPMSDDDEYYELNHEEPDDFSQKRSKRTDDALNDLIKQLKECEKDN